MQLLTDTLGDWLARDNAENYNGLSVTGAGWAPASLRTLASESVAGQAGHLACLPESPLPPLPTPALPGDGLVFPPSPTETTPALSFVGVVYTSATIASMQRKG